MRTELKEKSINHNQLGFGKIFTNHMFVMQYSEGRGWYNAEIKPYGPFVLDPATLVLHYAQALFEGMKSFFCLQNKIKLFRPRENLKRLNGGAKRLCMPQINESFVLKSLKALIDRDRSFHPQEKGTAFYIRPFMFASERGLGARSANEYIFSIILSPSGSYYEKGFMPLKIWIEDNHIRAFRGGTGDIKAAANYCGGFFTLQKAKKYGCDNILWLDENHQYIEEVGTMNIFFLIGDEVITPDINGTILPGIVRESIIEILGDLKIKVSERRISIAEICKACLKGELTEIFATGTAAIITSIGSFLYKEQEYIVKDNQVGNLTQRLYEILTSIQHGEMKQYDHWLEDIDQ